jgi:hypothetical protein
MIWNATLLATYGLALIALHARFGILRDPGTALAFLAIWGRYLLAGFHEYTYPPLVAGLSPIAMFTAACALTGIVFVPLRVYARYYLIPFYMLIMLAVFSGVVNLETRGLADTLMRWMFFLVVALLLLRAMGRYGTQHILQALLLLHLTPLLMQTVGIVFAPGAPAALYGSGVHDAAYAHNANFSNILMTGLCIAALVRWHHQIIPLALALFFTNGIVLANYRTTIIATMPVFIMLVTTVVTRSALPAIRPLLFFLFVSASVALVLLAATSLPERFGDVFRVPTMIGDLIKPAYEYTPEESSLFTGRIYVWAQYIEAWLDGNAFNKIFGFGPESFHGKTFTNSPHNISFLYEMGIIGLLLPFVILATPIIMALRLADMFIGLRLVACFTGFFVLGITAVPFTAVEGMILLAILCATTWAYAQETEAHPAASSLLARRRLGDRWRTGGRAALGPSNIKPPSCGRP